MSDTGPNQYRDFLAATGLTQEGFAELMGSGGRTGRRWAAEGVPAPVDMMIRLLTERPELLEVVRKLAAQRDGVDHAETGTDRRGRRRVAGG